jgi:predicted nucleic acid binding AN1-type Zn finger protein
MSRSSNSQDRETHLLSVGKQCSAPSCHLVDFLPFKCQHCEESFCGDHFKTVDHNCPKYDETKFNRVAPNCPLCNEPIAIRPGQDPNIRMDQHISNECSVMTGKSGKAKSAPVCARGKCGKVLFAPIRCDVRLPHIPTACGC